MADIRNDRSECLHYDNPDFHVQFRKNIINADAILDISIHWHDEVEFIYVIEGSIRYQLQDKIVQIKAGEGIFVNSRQLHLIVSNHCDVILYCLIFHPTILCASNSVAEKFVSPIVCNDSLSHIMLSSSVAWQEKILKSIEEIYGVLGADTEELGVMRLIYSIWETLSGNIVCYPDTDNGVNRDLALVKEMISYIHQHYTERVTIKQLCEVGWIGKTKCTSLFDRYVNMTPMQYVKNYRIERSIKLLRETDRRITEIAYDVGFSEGSYFSESFRQVMGVSPQQFRLMDKKREIW
ncbi:MAG: AraC family transcriptional regulator [Clostridium sp.]|nr:AraC family transcriptional regulator [Clostridium sp.]